MSTPQSVSLALALLWASLALDPLKLLFASSSPMVRIDFTIAYITSAIFVFPILIFLIVMIHYGKNWARVTTTLFIVLGFFIIIPRWAVGFGTAPVLIIFEMLLSAAQIYAIVLLYSEGSSTYFDGNPSDETTVTVEI